MSFHENLASARSYIVSTLSLSVHSPLGTSWKEEKILLPIELSSSNLHPPCKGWSQSTREHSDTKGNSKP